MKNLLLIFAMLFGFNGFSQNFIASNSDVSTSNHLTEVIAPKVTKIEKLYFLTNDATLSEESILSLNAVVMVLKDNPKMHISINSYTDVDETDSLLSSSRALKVKHFLVKNGITPDRLTTINFGNSKPIYEGHLSEFDRRVEFIFE